MGGAGRSTSAMKRTRGRYSSRLVTREERRRVACCGEEQEGVRGEGQERPRTKSAGSTRARGGREAGMVEIEIRRDHPSTGTISSPRRSWSMSRMIRGSQESRGEGIVGEKSG